jgi:outer membrane protein assembly factor BamE
MQKLLISMVVLATMALAGCSAVRNAANDIPNAIADFSGVYRPEVQQGNVVTQDMVNQLRPGMVKQQASFILGTPLLIDVFHQDRWDYLYRLEEDGENKAAERLTLYFENDRLVRIEGDYRPEPMAAASALDRETVFEVPDQPEKSRGIVSWLLDSVGLGGDDTD